MVEGALLLAAASHRDITEKEEKPLGAFFGNVLWFISKTTQSPILWFISPQIIKQLHSSGCVSALKSSGPDPAVGICTCIWLALWDPPLIKFTVFGLWAQRSGLDDSSAQDGVRGYLCVLGLSPRVHSPKWHPWDCTCAAESSNWPGLSSAVWPFQ